MKIVVIQKCGTVCLCRSPHFTLHDLEEKISFLEFIYLLAEIFIELLQVILVIFDGHGTNKFIPDLRIGLYATSIRLVAKSLGIVDPIGNSHCLITQVK